MNNLKIILFILKNPINGPPFGKFSRVCVFVLKEIKN